MNMVNGVSFALKVLPNGPALQVANDDERDGRLDGAFASMLSFGSTTSAKLHTQTMADAEQMFQAKGADGALEDGSTLQEGSGNEYEKSDTLTELGGKDESRIDAKARRSRGMIEGSGSSLVGKGPSSGTNVPFAATPKLGATVIQSTASRAEIGGPTREMPGALGMPQNGAALLSPAANSVVASPSFVSTPNRSPALQIADLLKGGGIESGRSTTVMESGNNSHSLRPENAGLPKAKGTWPESRGSSSFERPSETKTPKFDELVKSLRMQMGAKQSSARLRLQPPELGHLRVDVKVLGDRVRIDVQTETDAARDLLSRRADQLKSGLASQGIRLERLEVILNNSAVATAVGSSAGLAEFAPLPPVRLAEVQRPRGTQRDESRSSGRQRMSRSGMLATADARLDING